MADGDPIVLGQTNAATKETVINADGANTRVGIGGFAGLEVGADDNAIYASCARKGGIGIWGNATSRSGGAVGNGVGVLGYGHGAGVVGILLTDAPVQPESPGYADTAGVRGISDAHGGVGVHGWSQHGPAIIGDTFESFGVMGKSLRGTGVYASSDQGYGLWCTAARPRSGYAAGIWGNLLVAGQLIVAGQKSAAVPLPDGSYRRMYSLESPESWFEDFGSARLVRGRARVKLDRQFAALVRTARYHVFLTPEGDSNGLYVGAMSRTGFDVREQRAGKSSLRFSYRIVAKRKDVPADRLAKVNVPARPPSPPPAKRPEVPEPARAASARRPASPGRR